MYLTELMPVLFRFVFALGCGESAERKVFDQIVQRFTVSARKGTETDAGASFAIAAIEDSAFSLERLGRRDPHPHSRSHRKTGAVQEKSAYAQVVRGILDANRISVDLHFYRLVQQHAGKRPCIRAFHGVFLLEAFSCLRRHLLVRPARLHGRDGKRAARDVGAIVGDKCQSVKLIKLIILIEIDYQHKMGIKGYLYSLYHQRFAPFCLEY
jgi:hypothetical protein